MNLKRKNTVALLLFIGLSLFALGVILAPLRDASFISEAYSELLKHSGCKRKFLIKLIGEIVLQDVIVLSLGASCALAIMALFSTKNRKRLAHVSVFCGFVPFVYEIVKAIPLFSVNSGKLWTLPVGIALIACLMVALWFLLNSYLYRGGELKYFLVFLTASCFIRAIPTNFVRSFHMGELSLFRAEWISILFFGCGAFAFLALFLCEKEQPRLASRGAGFFEGAGRGHIITAVLILTALLALVSVFTALYYGIRDYFIQKGAFILGAIIFIVYLLFHGDEKLLLISVCLMETLACPSLFVIYERSLYIELAKYGETNYVAIGFSIATVLALILFTCLAFIKGRGKWAVAPVFLALACADLAVKPSTLPLIAVLCIAIMLPCIAKRH